MHLNSFNKNQLIRAFNRTAKTFHEAQTLQNAIGKRLLDRLDFIKTNPSTLLDIGAANGQLTSYLAQKYPHAQTLGLDIAKHRLFQAPKTNILYLCGDADNLPLKHQSIDLIFSNLTLHWCEDLLSVFQQIRRTLQLDGLFIFSMLGVDTLKEIRESWQCVDDNVHVYDFFDMHQVGDALLQAGFQDPVMDMEHVFLEYPDLSSFFLDLKKSGVTNFSPYRAKGLLSRSRYQQFLQAIQKTYQDEQALPVTFEIIYGYAISKFTVVSE